MKEVRNGVIFDGDQPLPVPESMRERMEYREKALVIAREIADYVRRNYAEVDDQMGMAIARNVQREYDIAKALRDELLFVRSLEVA